MSNKEFRKKILCVFPNDPIIAYYQKGEIKERYFNLFKDVDTMICW